MKSQFAVISNLTVCDGDGVSPTFLAVMRCSLIFFAVFSLSEAFIFCGVHTSLKLSLMK